MLTYCQQNKDKLSRRYTQSTCFLKIYCYNDNITLGYSTMTAKDARVDIKITKAAKATLEQAAYSLGTTLSAFILDCAIPKAKEILSQADLIRLTREENERFIAALQSPPKANEKLKQLFKKHNIKPNHRERT